MAHVMRLTRVTLALWALLLIGCGNTTAPPQGAADQSFVATPAPVGPGTTIPVPTPNVKPDPALTPVAILGLTVDENGHEVVLIGNISSEEQQIGGWALYNKRTELRFDFPAGLTLQPSQVVRVHSGPGGIDNPPGDFLWSTERRWTDPQEDVLLLNRADRLMYWYVASTQ